MKPNTKSKYFYLSIASFIVYVVHLFVLRGMVTDAMVGDSAASSPTTIAFYLPYAWVGLSGLFMYKSTKANQAFGRQVLAFLLTPLVLTPVLGFLYVLIVLMPLYNLAGQV